MGSRRNLQNWNTKKVRKLRKNLKLSKNQKAALIGTILGDGCLTKNAYGKHCRLQIEHKELHKEYVDWKYELFQKWCLSKPRIQERTNSWKFRIISHPIFTKFRKLFYKGGKKIIPKSIGELLKDPLSLSVWFMDDGGNLAERGILLNVQQFSLKEVELIQKVLRKNFGISSTKQWNNSGYRLYFGKDSRMEFQRIVKNFILPCLEYKLLLTP